MNARSLRRAGHHDRLAPLTVDLLLPSAHRRPGGPELDPDDVTRLEPGVRQRPDFTVERPRVRVALDRHRADAATFLGRAGDQGSPALGQPRRLAGHLADRTRYAGVLAVVVPVGLIGMRFADPAVVTAAVHEGKL